MKNGFSEVRWAVGVKANSQQLIANSLFNAIISAVPRIFRASAAYNT